MKSNIIQEIYLHEKKNTQKEINIKWVAVWKYVCDVLRELGD